VDVRDRLLAVQLGCVGAPSDWLVGSQTDATTVREVWGPRLVTVPIDEVRNALARVDASAVGRMRDEVVARAERTDEPGAHDLERAASVALALHHVVDARGLQACTVRCFDIVTSERTTGCLALSMLLDENVVAGCEGDVPATLTMLWIQAMTGQVSFMANPQDLDTAAGVVWLAHCTIARRLVRRYALRSHFESSLGVAIEGHLEAGPVTLARIGGADLRELFVSDGWLEASEAEPRRCRTQVRVRLDSGAGSLLTAPLGNHHVLVAGHWAARLREYHDLFVRPAAPA
jgi:L-fucose isomerase-like protein